MDFWSRLFDSTGFIPRAQCGEWTPALIRLHNGSDFLIWTAYLAIPMVLARFAWRRRQELPFAQVFWLFGLFIIACGSTHLMDIVLFYNPLYRLSGAIKLVTAAASWGTVVALVPIVPRALAMRSPELLELEIHEREKAEAEVRLLNSELESRVLERTLQLEAANRDLEVANRSLEAANRDKDELLVREQAARREAEAANKSKDEFLATLSHELRTPLNAIAGWTFLLRSGKLSAEQTEQGLETIERSTRLQTQLVEDIVDVSKIIGGDLRLDSEPVELAPIVQSIELAQRPAAQTKNIAVQTTIPDPSLRVLGDARRLQQIVSNLLANAIKFTPEGGAVNLRLEPAPGEHGASARLTVSDNGEGMAPEFVPHVFERFRQADSSSTRRHGGLGLGLAVVRHLAELQGGQVHAHSDGLGLGATLTVDLPLLQPAAAEPAAAEPPGLAVV